MAKNTGEGSFDFVAELVDDPEKPPRVAVLLGWPGRSPKAGHVRIWFSLALTIVIDVPDEEILLQRLYPGGLFSLTVFWIRADYITRTFQELSQSWFWQSGSARP